MILCLHLNEFYGPTSPWTHSDLNTIIIIMPPVFKPTWVDGASLIDYVWREKGLNQYSIVYGVPLQL